MVLEHKQGNFHHQMIHHNHFQSNPSCNTIHLSHTIDIGQLESHNQKCSIYQHFVSLVLKQNNSSGNLIMQLFFDQAQSFFYLTCNCLVLVKRFPIYRGSLPNGSGKNHANAFFWLIISFLWFFLYFAFNTKIAVTK